MATEKRESGHVANMLSFAPLPESPFDRQQKPWKQIVDVYKLSLVLIDGKLVYGTGAAALPAANMPTLLASTKIGTMVDDIERPDQRSSPDTLWLKTTDGGMDRSLEISQIVPFSALKSAAMGKRAGTPWSADGLVQVELGGTREAGERIWMQIHNVKFY